MFPGAVIQAELQFAMGKVGVRIIKARELQSPGSYPGLRVGLDFGGPQEQLAGLAPVSTVFQFDTAQVWFMKGALRIGIAAMGKMDDCGERKGKEEAHPLHLTSRF